jgi:hypothetical protein
MHPNASLIVWAALRVRLQRVRVDWRRGRGLVGPIRCRAAIVRRWRWHGTQIECDRAACRVFCDLCSSVDRGARNHGVPFG